MYRIFIVEDDEVITAALCAYTARWGFESVAWVIFSMFLPSLPPLTRSLF